MIILNSISNEREASSFKERTWCDYCKKMKHWVGFENYIHIDAGNREFYTHACRECSHVIGCGSVDKEEDEQCLYNWGRYNYLYGYAIDYFPSLFPPGTTLDFSNADVSLTKDVVSVETGSPLSGSRIYDTALNPFKGLSDV